MAVSHYRMQNEYHGGLASDTRNSHLAEEFDGGLRVIFTCSSGRSTLQFDISKGSDFVPKMACTSSSFFLFPVTKVIVAISLVVGLKAMAANGSEPKTTKRSLVVLDGRQTTTYKALDNNVTGGCA
jgi:hypothetical protein